MAPTSYLARPKLAKTPLVSKKIKPLDEKLAPEKNRWTFFTNHAHVLILLSQEPSLVLREVALKIGITERAVQRIIADLEQDGFIEREKVGRKNQYQILLKRPLRHPVEAHRSIGDVIAMIGKGH
jgi:predicted DNA-binding transcriptional regulator